MVGRMAQKALGGSKRRAESYHRSRLTYQGKPTTQLLWRGSSQPCLQARTFSQVLMQRYHEVVGSGPSCCTPQSVHDQKIKQNSRADSQSGFVGPFQSKISLPSFFSVFYAYLWQLCPRDISHALGMHGIHCTQPSGRFAPSCSFAINAIYPSHP